MSDRDNTPSARDESGEPLCFCGKWWGRCFDHSVYDVLDRLAKAERRAEQAEEEWRHQERLKNTAQDSLGVAETKLSKAKEALEECVSALDGLLGDSDLPDDDRPGVRAMQSALAAIRGVSPDVAEYCTDCGAEILGYHSCEGRP